MDVVKKYSTMWDFVKKYFITLAAFFIKYFDKMSTYILKYIHLFMFIRPCSCSHVHKITIPPHLLMAQHSPLIKDRKEY